MKKWGRKEKVTDEMEKSEEGFLKEKEVNENNLRGGKNKNKVLKTTNMNHNKEKVTFI